MAKKKTDLKNPMGVIVSEWAKTQVKKVKISQRQRTNRAHRQAKAGKATYSRHSASRAGGVARGMNKKK